MDWAATIRIAFLGTALAFTLPASADTELDALVMDHVMPRFDREARIIVRNSGARYVSSSWNRETRTLIAMAEMDRRVSAGPFTVALETNTAAKSPGLKSKYVAELCRNPKVSLMSRFLEKYDVRIVLVYAKKHQPVDPVTVEISYDDLSSCV